MPQLKTLFLSSVSENLVDYENLKLVKSSFALLYKKTNTNIPLDDLFETWCGKKKEERDIFLKQYFRTFSNTLEESQFSEPWNDTLKNSIIVRLRHVSALGNNPFVSKVIDILDKKMEHIDSGLRLVCEAESKETKHAMVLMQKKWLETMQVTEDEMLSTAISNLNQKFKNERKWRDVLVTFPENPSFETETFYLSDFKDVYTCTRAILFPDVVLPLEVIQEVRNGSSSWVLITLGDDLVALAKSTNRWALLQVSQYFLERIAQPPSSYITELKALRLTSSRNLLRWQLYSPNYKMGEGYPPRSKLEFDAVKNGIIAEVRSKIENDLKENKEKQQDLSEQKQVQE